MRSSPTVLAARATALAAALALGGAGCSFITGIPSVSRVELTVTPSTISVNQTATAVGTAYDGDTPIRNPKRAVNYSSSDQTIATVNPTSGVIIGLKPGKVTITGTSDDKSASADLTVQLLQARNLVINNPRQPVYRVGALNGISATAYDSANNVIRDRLPTWTVRNSKVLTVSSAGVITPLTTDTTTIVATFDNGPGQKTVSDSVVARVTLTPVTAIRITPNNDNNNTPTIYTGPPGSPGNTLQFSATLTDSLNNTVTRPLVWSTPNPGANLTIDRNSGQATGVSPTTYTTVTVTADVVPGETPLRSIAQTVSVAVLAPADSVRVFANGGQITTLTVAKGSNTGIGVQAYDAIGTQLSGRNVRLSSDNTSVFTVPASASTGTAITLTAVNPGTATLTAQALDVNNNPQGKQSKITITVTP